MGSISRKPFRFTHRLRRLLFGKKLGNINIFLIFVVVFLVIVSFRYFKLSEDILQGPSICESIDLVYTWVRDDQENRELLRRAYPQRVYSQSRYRDYEHLKYGLRSIEKYAPWIRKIFIVTNGQIPEWWDDTQKRAEIITHNQIFQHPEKDLPNFNSNAIESNLHHIPGIGDCFIYLNDDVFFGNNIKPSDFFVQPLNQSVLYFSGWTVDPPDAVITNVWRASIRYSDTLLEDIYGKPEKPRRFALHGPFFFVKEYLNEMETIWTSEFSNTAASPFRQRDNIQLPFLYNNYILAENYPRKTPRPSFEYVKLNDNASEMKQKLYRIYRLQPKFICLNDALRENPDMTNKGTPHQIHYFYERWFPDRSPFERSDFVYTYPWDDDDTNTPNNKNDDE